MKNNDKIFVPPIKIQGKKTKLVSFILENLPEDAFEVWIEPFMGSGVVGFNAQPRKAIFADSNPHIINFYSAPFLWKKFERCGLCLSEAFISG